ncbi:hypothetical protein GL2_07470 [Microbulbifer sp. GL-2]|nr:hypothetical protein GL2_07470 [Microbulbifer sp. GL-2]
MSENHIYHSYESLKFISRQIRESNTLGELDNDIVALKTEESERKTNDFYKKKCSSFIYYPVSDVKDSVRYWFAELD